MTEDISVQTPDDDDRDLVPALTAMLERRADSAEAKPNLANVRADARNANSSIGRFDRFDRFGGGQNGQRRGAYQIALAAAALIVLVGGVIAVGSRSLFTETGPASDVNSTTTSVGEAESDNTADESVADEQESADTASPDTASPDTASTEPPPTGTAPADTAPTDAEDDAPADDSITNQAEPDLRFDYGDISRVERVDGVDWIWFDRWSFGDPQQQGPELLSEPRYELATDWHGGENRNPMLRSYPLAPEVRILQLNPDIVELSCSFEPYSGEEFVESDLPTMLAAEAGRVSLTFDDDGYVTLVRDQMSC